MKQGIILSSFLRVLVIMNEKVHDCISRLLYQIKKEEREREDYDFDVEELVEHYYMNQEDYSRSFLKISEQLHRSDTKNGK